MFGCFPLVLGKSETVTVMRLYVNVVGGVL